MPRKKKQDKMLRITYVKSAVGRSEKQKRTIRALGLRRLNQSVVHRATPQILGMVAKVQHLVTVEEIEEVK